MVVIDGELFVFGAERAFLPNQDSVTAANTDDIATQRDY